MRERCLSGCNVIKGSEAQEDAQHYTGAVSGCGEGGQGEKFIPLDRECNTVRTRETGSDQVLRLHSKRMLRVIVCL